MLDLSGTRLKLRRAEQHREFLAHEIGGFLQHKPYRVTTELQDRKRVVFRGWIDAHPNPEWGLIAGEFAHQARSALDIMIYEAAPRRVRRSDRAEFPIFAINKTDRRNGIRPIMDFLPPEAFAVVERAQPYQRRDVAPKFDLLAILGDLNNADKHRVLPMVSCPAGLSVRMWGGGLVPEVRAVSITAGRVAQHGAPIAEVILGQSLKGTTVQMQPYLTMQVQFGEGTVAAGLPVVELCRDILARVTVIVDQFEACFR